MNLLMQAASGGGQKLWTSGSAEVILGYQFVTGKLPIAARVVFGNATPEWALLDTGSEWSLVGASTAGALANSEPLQEIPVSTRLGKFRGRLHRMQLTLIADEGTDVSLEGTVLVLGEDWSGPNIIGVRGFLEWVHFAIDAGSTPASSPRIFFGPTSQ